MDNDLTTIGALIAAIIALAEVIKILASRWSQKKSGNPNGEGMIKHIAENVDRLVELHTKTDEDGVPVWYVKRSMEQSIKDLCSAVKDLSKNVEKFGDLIKAVKEDTVSMKKDIQELVITNKLKKSGRTPNYPPK